MIITWKRYDRRLPIEIVIDDNLEACYVLALIKKLLNGSYEALNIPPRGRNVMLVTEDCAVLYPSAPNTEATNMVGIPVCGDCVIVEKDLWERVKGY